jgi:hypothetical protein
MVNQVVFALETVLLPELERRRSCLALDLRYTEAKVFSLRHHEILHTIGLTCHPVSAATAEESYCLYVNVIGLSGITLRGFVGWHQQFEIDRLPGYTIYEAKTPLYQVESEKDLGEFLGLLPALFKGFERGLRRGRPPSTLRQLCHRLVSGKR